ncbi:hypothetical protein BK816_03130 [Boudabousia tangfeifanii]|uniref:Uncharacterized protein n=1 Tax=Boudabousia tangfeifanii TaxID=1912795 RepID=A0A1D9MJP4_9ACTO|nr:hypothetical protein [Boudabousia tangfeifanii]AOZ72409.1 hypothetical protein BK816_03130 [Boudabousia tangfeifanii]
MSNSKWSGLFSDMPLKGWIFLTLAMISFFVNVGIYHSLKDQPPGQEISLFTLSVYFISIVLAFVFLIIFTYIAWRVGEDRRKVIDQKMAEKYNKKYMD